MQVDGTMPPDAHSSSDPHLAEQLDPHRRFAETLHFLTPKAWVTPAILILNAGVFAAMVLSGVGIMSPQIGQLLDWGADFGPMTTGGEWWRLLSCMFVHIGILHLILNMWALWNAGLLVERLLGNAGFLVMYIASGLVGNLASLFWNPLIVSAGASGAVFGVFGALLGILLRHRSSFPPGLLGRLGRSTGTCIGYNLLFGFSSNGIDNAAHVGGLVAGFLCGLALAQPIDKSAHATRTKRAMNVGFACALAVAAGIGFVPRGMSDYYRERESLRKLEETAFPTLNRESSRLEAGEIEPAELARVFEEQILPQWREARERMVAIPPLPSELEADRATLLEYVRLRQEAWEGFARGLRDGDETAMKEALKKQKAAEEVIKKMADD